MLFRSIGQLYYPCFIPCIKRCSFVTTIRSFQTKSSLSSAQSHSFSFFFSPRWTSDLLHLNPFYYQNEPLFNFWSGFTHSHYQQTRTKPTYSLLQPQVRHNGRQPLLHICPGPLGRRHQPRRQRGRHVSRHLLGCISLRLRHDLQHLRPYRSLEGPLRPCAYDGRFCTWSAVIIHGLACCHGVSHLLSGRCRLMRQSLDDKMTFTWVGMESVAGYERYGRRIFGRYDTSRYLTLPIKLRMGWIAYRSDLEFECIPHRYNI